MDYFNLFGTYHPACGRILKGQRKQAALEDEAMDKVPAGILPVHHAIEGARAFALHKGLADPHSGVDYSGVKTNRALLSELAHHYDRLPENDPSSHRHFNAMKSEVGDQYHFLTHKMGIGVEVKDHDPYKNIHELRHDVEKNHRIQVLGTHATGGHPFFSDEENDKFRAVHDVFGHLATGRGFDRHGEEAAFQAHARMFTHHALPALTSETRGQNGSLIVNGHFGPQKIAILPRHLWSPSAHLSSLVDDFRLDQHAQNIRAEDHTRGNRTELRSYFGDDDSGERTEKRLNFKDYLRQNRKQTEGDLEDESWAEGHNLGLQHRHQGIHPHQVHEFNHSSDSTFSPEHFTRGYMQAQANMTNRVAVVLSGTDDLPVGLTVVAHVSGNSIDVLHCPFCGSGTVIARSDGTIECGYCMTVFTVQVQPAYPGFPQSVDGQPYTWPGMPDPMTTANPDVPAGGGMIPGQDPAAMGGDPMNPAADPNAMGDEEGGDDNPFAKGSDSGDSDDSSDDSSDDKPAKKGDNPFAKKKSSVNSWEATCGRCGQGLIDTGKKWINEKGKATCGDSAYLHKPKQASYRTAQGAELPYDEFVAHLAIQYANNPLLVAQNVRQARERGL